MAQNALGPSYVRLPYTSSGHTHVMQFGVATDYRPGDTGMPDLNVSGGATGTMIECLDAFLTVLAPFFNVDDSFGPAELFYRAEPDDAPVWCYTAMPTVDAGSSIQLDNPWGQCSFSFRTRLGGKWRLQLMEGVWLRDFKQTYGGLVPAGAPKVLVDFLLGQESCLMGRDGAYPAVMLTWTSKVNDHLRRRYLQDTPGV
jgi:hypothetical protein